MPDKMSGKLMRPALIFALTFGSCVGFAQPPESQFGFGGTAGPRSRREGDIPAFRSMARPRQIPGGPAIQKDEPRDFSIMISGAIPDLWSATLHWRINERFAFEFRAAPETQLNLRIEMPADLISTKKNIGVANPAYKISGKAGSGPGGGIGVVFYPYLSGRDGGGWFVGAGLEQRRLTLTGTTRSPVLICSLIEAQKDPPCGNVDAALVTRTELDLDASLETSGTAWRAWTGWRLNFGSAGSGGFAGRGGTTFIRRTFMEFALGAERVTNPRRKTRVNLSLLTPGLEDPETDSALGILKDQNTEKAGAKLANALNQYDSKVTPVAWLGAGVWL
jgi:hypothetical protein